MPPSELLKIDDDSLIARALKPAGKKRSLTETVPEDIEPREALANIKECVSNLNKLGNATSVVGAILGKHMAIMAKRPEIYEAAGYDSLKAFEQAEIVGKISHGSVFNYKLIAEQFPEMPVEQVLETGSTNLVRAARVCKSIEASPAQKKKILEKATELNTQAFTEWIEKKSGVSEPGATTTDSYLLIGTSAQITELKEHLAEPQFKEFAQTDTAVGMVLAAIQESRDLWPKDQKKVQSGAQEEGGGW
jgi:hypothetical protein